MSSLSLTPWLVDDVVVEEPDGTADRQGNRGFGAQATIKARVERFHEVNVGTGGNERLSKHQFVTETEVSLQARVWLPTEGDTPANDQEARRVLRVSRARLKDGSEGHFHVFLD